MIVSVTIIVVTNENIINDAPAIKQRKALSLGMNAEP